VRATLPFLLTLGLAAAASAQERAFSDGTGHEALEPLAKAGTDLPSQLLASMSLSDKVSQMIMSYPPLDPDAPVAVGSVIFLGNLLRNGDALKRRVASLQRRARVPLLTAVDMEGGRLNRLQFVKELKKVPSARELGALGETEARRWGKVVGKAMASLGLNTSLAPVLDLAESGLMAASGRSIGSDPDAVARIGRAYAQGLRAQGIIAIGKHYPGYGEVARNSDHFLVVSDRTPAGIAHDAGAFRGVRDELGGVMLANVGFRSYGGMPAILSPRLVAMAHEEGWLTVTDDLAIRILSDATGGDQEEVVRRAFLAGNDILLTTEPIDWKQAIDVRGVVMDLVRARPELEAQVDESVLRILRLKETAGLLAPLSAPPRTAQGAVPLQGRARGAP
jgi:beta-N-acetylhexosaminidase